MVKKIVFLTNSLGAGGAERVIVNLANFLSENYIVSIYVLVGNKSHYYLKDTIKVVFLNENYKKSNFIIDGLIKNLRTLKKIRLLSIENSFDFVISFTVTLNIIALFPVLFGKAKIIISERSNPNIYKPNFIWGFLRKVLYGNCDNLVVQTDGNKLFFSDFVDEKKIITIPNPISNSLIEKRIEYNTREKIILTVGRLDYNKNHQLLLHAFARLNLPDWKIRVVGDGILKQELVELAKELNISDAVDFIGNVKDVENYYNTASIFAFTSLSEGFPNALLEALSFGLPTISSNCDFGPSNLIEHNVNGLLFKNNNLDELINNLQELVNNNDLRLKLSSNAIQKASKFETEKIANQWLQLIN